MSSFDNLKASAQMLIRRPVGEVFKAFTDPGVTTRFWFTRSSGKLEAGKGVRWDWEMYGVSAEVTVNNLQTDQFIEITWGEPPRTVQWLFEEYGNGNTLVRITESGFSGTDEERVAQAIDSKGGFTSVLAGLKALLEHNIELNLVGDQHPEAHANR